MSDVVLKDVVADLRRCAAVPALRDVRVSVATQFGNLCVHRVISWRGDYAELALELWQWDETDESMSVSELHSVLRDAMTGKETYQGYKGGTYTMRPDTLVCAVLAHSDVGETRVLGVRHIDRTIEEAEETRWPSVVLKTRWERDDEDSGW